MVRSHQRPHQGWAQGSYPACLPQDHESFCKMPGTESEKGCSPTFCLVPLTHFLPPVMAEPLLAQNADLQRLERGAGTRGMCFLFRGPEASSPLSEQASCLLGKNGEEQWEAELAGRLHPLSNTKLPWTVTSRGLFSTHFITEFEVLSCSLLHTAGPSRAPD